MMNRNFVVGEFVRLVLANSSYGASGIVWKCDGETVWLEHDYFEQKIRICEIVDVIR